MATIKKHTLPRPDGLIETETVLDVGPGLRPFGWYSPQTHICVEPCDTYADALEAAGFLVIRQTADIALAAMQPGDFDAIYMLDVIEHMDRATGARCIDLIEQLKPRQAVIYTPLGFVKQTADGWETSEDEWQTHRSGWYLDDFKQRGWRPQSHGKGFFAIWEPERIHS